MLLPDLVVREAGLSAGEVFRPIWEETGSGLRKSPRSAHALRFLSQLWQRQDELGGRSRRACARRRMQPRGSDSRYVVPIYIRKNGLRGRLLVVMRSHQFHLFLALLLVGRRSPVAGGSGARSCAGLPTGAAAAPWRPPPARSASSSGGSRKLIDRYAILRCHPLGQVQRECFLPRLQCT
jgi:hypothetical protein